MNSYVSIYPIIPSHLKKKVKALKKLQLEHVNLKYAFSTELQKLEQKYENLFIPLYEKRKEFVTGSAEPTEECNYSSGEEGTSEEIRDLKINDSQEKEKKGIKGIPEFWLTTLKHAELLTVTIKEYDEPILKHLIDIKATVYNDPVSFLLEFVFEPNEFFTNGVLTKYYEIKCEPERKDLFLNGPIIIKSQGCTIYWKPNMNVTTKIITKKQKSKVSGAVHKIRITVRKNSFFNFFNPPIIPEGCGDVMSDEQSNLLTADFEIGNYIKNNIIPQAVLFFTGENLGDDEFDDKDDEKEDEESKTEANDDKSNKTEASIQHPLNKNDVPNSNQLDQVALNNHFYNQMFRMTA